MSKRQSFVALLLVLGLVMGAAALFAQAQPKTEGAVAAEAFKPVQTVENMMQGQKKLYDDIKAGILDQKWPEASKSAWILAEIANVNQYQNEHADYKKHAHDMSIECASLAQLLKKRDEAGSKEQMRKIGQICSECHKQFKK